MTSWWRRLAAIARAQVGPLRLPPADAAAAAEDAPSAAAAAEGQATSTASGSLPYSEELARCYAALDLPFGAPLEEVTRRWKAYLKRCHPDRHATEPEKLAAATELTQILTEAYQKIKAAWQRQQA
ncbi:MAG: hypothetical protein KatS3mg131_0694 [Candidatus Tectimicrobiota bacterium]|nr:MAG: hypothetical protein KatS3mg131_0694 [Candidatus Tectomicrobia bacterium]